MKAKNPDFRNKLLIFGLDPGEYEIQDDRLRVRYAGETSSRMDSAAFTLRPGQSDSIHALVDSIPGGSYGSTYLVACSSHLWIISYGPGGWEKEIIETLFRSGGGKPIDDMRRFRRYMEQMARDSLPDVMERSRKAYERELKNLDPD